MDKTVLTVKLIAWPGWGVVGTTAALAVLLTGILALLLPFPDSSLTRQLQNHQDRLDLRSRLGLAPIFESYRTAIRRFNTWLDEWFGPPLSGQAFERCLAIAFIYPVSIFLLTLVINGMVTGKVSLEEFFIFIGAAILGSFIAFKLFGRLVRFTQRLWNMLGGDVDIAPVLAKVGLGVIAVVTAFAIAFAIASVMSSEFYGAGSVAIAVLAAFALAFMLAITFAFAGAGVFAAVVAIIAAVAFAFASEFAFVLLLFFVMIPLVNACADWLSWAATRSLLRIVEKTPDNTAGLTKLAGLLLTTGLVSIGLALALTGLLANTLEILSAAFSAIGNNAFAWKPLLEKASKAPWTEGLFVTGMLLTPLVPVFLHLTVGLTGMLVRFTPNAHADALTITEHPDVIMDESEIRTIRSTVLLSRLWYLPAAAAVFSLFILVGAALHFSGIHVSRFLADFALCVTAWGQGQCPL